MKKVFLGIVLAFNCLLNAQNNPKEVLFTIDNSPFYTDEFERVYKKNLDLVKDESQKDLDKYLELYLGYKLKVTKANKLGLQNDVKYQNELKGYRAQLSKNYIYNSKVTAALIQEGYDRMQKEVNASHILIMVDENAVPSDTLVAYKKILDIRQKAINGEDFGKLAQEFSQDPSAKENQGNLGYFSSFRMVYDFENAAYKTEKGKISMPFRTRFGYHILKVNDVRANRGEITVAHIMILNPKDEEKEKAQSSINDIYKKIQQGESFEELAKQFSEDKASAPKGGLLNRFGSGQLSSPEFEEVAFGLSKEKPISAPFKSQFGWHIVKFVERFPVKSFEESKSEIENKIGKDDRSRIITNDLTEKLRKKYVIKKDKKTYQEVSKLVTNDFYDGKWEVPAVEKMPKTNLLTIDKKNIDGQQFLNFVKTQQKSGSSLKPIDKLLPVLYTKFENEQLNQYYNDNLEKEFPDFASVMEEYRDGLLLFDLMEKEIWDRSKTDTLGLKSFYEKHKNEHLWKTRAETTIFSSTNQEMIKKTIVMLSKNQSAQAIKDKLNTKDVVNVMAVDGVFEEGDSTLPKNTKMEVGVSDIIKNGEYYYVTKIAKIIPSGVKSLDECKGKIVNEYQQYLEQNWVDELKKEFAIKINQDIFQKVKQKLAN